MAVNTVPLTLDGLIAQLQAVRARRGADAPVNVVDGSGDEWDGVAGVMSVQEYTGESVTLDLTG